jgi:hypothetical protein
MDAGVQVACVSTVPQAEETPQFQGLPTGLKVTAFGDQTCRRGEGAEPPEACAPACTVRGPPPVPSPRNFTASEVNRR